MQSGRNRLQWPESLSSSWLSNAALMAARTTPAKEPAACADCTRKGCAAMEIPILLPQKLNVEQTIEQLNSLGLMQLKKTLIENFMAAMNIESLQSRCLEDR